ncbi:hypothetical protein N5C66_23625 [Rhizobium pusense]|uniref:hypothetical protein n=1 Tax=Agrobacterium TaxID=357 RepID=UPI000D1BFE2F|nr:MULTISPECIES: hypothetical protein [Agrobacterium]MCD4662622.1 hypothetical protein [Agrobacterium sp.]MDH0910538.1 hypothetical protein [Agrobacterium pusense]MDH1098295.1 hypothetical protein [Agrobacterium pusense]MDH1114718.1 hypothetical protein [Agrobacterium pusense]MDH2195779.1 hypothetical protein [Agrobacterium pusense]
MSIDQHIEELRAELRNAVHRNERRWIEKELAKALAERELLWAEQGIWWAEQAGHISSEPPF